MRIVLPLKRPTGADRVIPRREVMDALNIVSQQRVIRLIEKVQLPQPVTIGNSKGFWLSELVKLYPQLAQSIAP